MTASWPLVVWKLLAPLIRPGTDTIVVQSSPADTALQRYGQVLSYLVYENTTYWTRSGFLLLAHTSLLGFTAVTIPALSRDAPPERVLLIAIIACVGLLLVRLWRATLQHGIDWIERWHRLLLQLEPEAYGHMHFFRGSVGRGIPAARHSVRQVAHKVALLFAIVWGGTFVYALVGAAILLGVL